jgi:hypothetical protein
VNHSHQSHLNQIPIWHELNQIHFHGHHLNDLWFRETFDSSMVLHLSIWLRHSMLRYFEIQHTHPTTTRNSNRILTHNSESALTKTSSLLNEYCIPSCPSLELLLWCPLTYLSIGDLTNHIDLEFLNVVSNLEHKLKGKRVGQIAQSSTVLAVISLGYLSDLPIQNCRINFCDKNQFQFSKWALYGLYSPKAAYCDTSTS